MPNPDDIHALANVHSIAILMALAQNSMRFMDIVYALDMHPQYVSNGLKELIKVGFVERSGDKYRITAEGLQVAMAVDRILDVIHSEESVAQASRILIVGNDTMATEALQRALGDEYEVMVVKDGAEAVRAYEMFRPELVLIDMVVPVTNGVETAKEIKRVDPDAKIVGLTTGARRESLLEAGALEVIERPLTKKQLVKVIKRYLGSEHKLHGPRPVRRRKIRESHRF